MDCYHMDTDEEQQEHHHHHHHQQDAGVSDAWEGTGMTSTAVAEELARVKLIWLKLVVRRCRDAGAILLAERGERASSPD
ncbi:hypothetical protein E2C01_073514 [Portunus trituberculatus]|uniref:Uncharacterized protein n=1 Tax=Portunus trituberculatus TaxID=210409 RepID=A0A5B7I9L4_PORTR|nr:hypothetical protein [Portunus trituberculatus]